MENEYLSLNYFRRFGIEAEINAFDLRSRPLGFEYDKELLPDGIFQVANLIQKVVKSRTVVQKWGNDHNNQAWIVKPDGSCGLEICSPVCKGWNDLKIICKVVQSLQASDKITADERCSLHVHVDVSDLSTQQAANILTWWVKCEPVFMDSVPDRRKKNRYCQCIGQTDLLANIEEGLLAPNVLISKLGHCKYYTINSFHYNAKNRNTLEFRIMENTASKNPWLIKNWVKLLIHFVERAAAIAPKNYVAGDPWTGYCWMDPHDVFKFLGFDQSLSPGLEQVRGWFLGRLIKNQDSDLPGVFGKKARIFARKQIEELAKMYPYRPSQLYSEEDLYGSIFNI